MKGCRPLTDDEVKAVAAWFARLRDRALFILGVRTGFRIRELVSLTLGDVFQNGKIVHEISVARKWMKGKREGRTQFLHEEAREVLVLLVAELAAAGHTVPETPLFLSREKGKAIDRKTAWHHQKKAFKACGLTGKLATHTMRKTFAKRMKKAVGGDLQALQKLMGHKQITSTMSYSDVDEDKLKDAVLKS